MSGQTFLATDAMARIRAQERADALIRLLRSQPSDGGELFRVLERLPRNELEAFADRLQKRLSELPAPR